MVARLQALSAESRATFWRSLQTFGATRVVIALVLLVYLSFDSRGLRVVGEYPYLPVCLAYLGLAVAFALSALYWRRRFLPQLLAQIACDLAVISLLYIAGGGVRSGLAILYLFPLAGSAILSPLVLALFCAALVALFMLGESMWQLLAMESQHGLLQSGLYGAAFFAAVFMVNRMAGKLIGQEELAILRGVEINVQQAVNRLVMANIGDGILVVDPDGQVTAGNPAARQMLGLAGPELNFKLSAAAPLAPLAQVYGEWRADPARSTVFITIKPFSDAALQGLTAAWSARRDLSAHLKVRFAAVDTSGPGLERSVIFLQDVTGIENQAQQLKLASMGRLTASIAHEVRNPLSAIGHATALLGEDLDSTVHLRLLKIVGDNVARVNRMVEDILQLSRKVQPNNEPLALDGFLAELMTEFVDTHGLPADIVGLSVAPGTMVRFDPLHLREVVLNLLNNAVRYASGAPRSIRVDLLTHPHHAQRMELHVQDDGPGISPEVRAHLFEPFYTTSSKGTGLGLYLARELCLNNEARLDYEYRFDSRDSADGGRRSSGRFVITFAQPAQK
ncbi:two-component system sensor histidine kinase PilS (NtrC family) [Duganella sp. 1411]|uniref:sensor histidine kinase n=1 Tax=Duganella sp. 1411 TaxID=2806572 RepID=UPI001AE8F02C|nr:ATP-binding protein [Duganella sp. 1411]MBP1206608.1 two-component system sensor histidine kinase PilS (NtrC family) [Duganella sp. 1411]